MTLTSVYVHFPWCLKKCPYCDFATRRIDRDAIPHSGYADAVIRELELRSAELEKRFLRSVFFGGGTPSLWNTEEIGRVLAAIRSAFDSGDALEVTVECNPSSLDADRAEALGQSGVTRLSVGVQATDDRLLRYLGRWHDTAGAFEALRAAVRHSERVSADIMFGLPGLETETLLAGLDAIVSAGVSHISAYALTIEPGTQFGELHRKGRLPIAPEERYAEQFLAAREALSDRGFSAYEVSNYAQPGEESRHNLHYWRGGAYVGLGAGAVGCLDDSKLQGRARRWRNEAEPKAYMARVRHGSEHAAQGLACEVSSETLGPEELIEEGLMLGLRTREGVCLDSLRARAHSDPLRGRESRIARRIEWGDLERNAERLRVPEERWLNLDSIVADLF